MRPLAIKIQAEVQEGKLRGCSRPGRVLEKKTVRGTSYQADAKAEPFLEHVT